VSSDLSDVGANRPFAGMAFDEMRSASAKPAARQAPREPTHAQHAGVENVSRSFHAHREPQQSTRFGPTRNDSFSRSKDGTILMRLPSARGGVCTPPAATPPRLTPVGSCRTGGPFWSQRKARYLRATPWTRIRFGVANIRCCLRHQGWCSICYKTSFEFYGC
jgi:hypothetical protein